MTDEVVVDVGPVAHGGHCVARHEGRVVFVRHTLPGERVRIRMTEADPEARYWRADAVEVLTASPDRVPSVWPEAGPDGVGGGELAHIRLDAQRRWKATVIGEQLRRLGGVDMPVDVEPAPGEVDGLGYRTRIALVADRDGRAGMHRYRSRDVLPLQTMPLAVSELTDLGLLGRRWPAGARITAVAPVGDRPVVLVDGVPWTDRGPDRRPNARSSVRETAEIDGRTVRWRVAADGFWQVHRAGPSLLVDVVLAAVGALDGATVLDLYAGAGLFTVPLAHRVGGTGRVLSVEGDPRAVRDARRNAFDLPQVDLQLGDVAQVLRGGFGPRADVVVLDPPRVGAGRVVVDEVVARRPRQVVYVACDPAALGRDVGYLAGHGYQVTGLRGLDLFPMTHHVETVAVLEQR